MALRLRKLYLQGVRPSTAIRDTDTLLPLLIAAVTQCLQYGLLGLISNNADRQAQLINNTGFLRIQML